MFQKTILITLKEKDLIGSVNDQAIPDWQRALRKILAGSGDTVIADKARGAIDALEKTIPGQSNGGNGELDDYEIEVALSAAKREACKAGNSEDCKGYESAIASFKKAKGS